MSECRIVSGCLPTNSDKEKEILLSLGGWLKTNGEGIYGSRPWKIFGEGPTSNEEGAHQEHKQKGYTAQDIRFTTKDDALYAWLMKWAGGDTTIKSLATGNAHEPRPVKSVTLLGHGPVEFKQSPAGLSLTLPKDAPTDYAHGLKIGF